MSRGKRKRAARNRNVAQVDVSNLPPELRQPQYGGPHMTVVQQEHHWEAPLPPPSVLEGYRALAPDAPERIFLMAEQEGANSRHIQRVAVWGTFISQVLGQACAFILAAGALWLAYKLAMAGHDGVAVIVGGTTVTTIVVSFLQTQKTKTRK